MAQSQEQSAELIQLADFLTHARDDRLNEIYLAVSTLFQHHNSDFSPRERALATDILRQLTKDVEMSIRISLAERVVESPDFPPELVLLLADDAIEVARPVLARSKVLADADLLRIIEAKTDDHRVTIAGRPAIGETITAALARCDCEAVVVALLRNKTAKIGSETFGQLVERARQSKDLQEPLAGRDDLPAQLAARLYTWVSGALKQALSQRYPGVASAIAQNVDETTAGLKAGTPNSSEVSAAKLVAKLMASGQLKASFLIRALQQGQIDLFEHGFAALLDMDVPTMRRALYEQHPASVALACRAVGIDRSVFQTVFNLSRTQRKISTVLSEPDYNRVQAVFNDVPKVAALDRLRQAAA